MELGVWQIAFAAPHGLWQERMGLMLAARVNGRGGGRGRQSERRRGEKFFASGNSGSRSDCESASLWGTWRRIRPNQCILAVRG